MSNKNELVEKQLDRLAEICCQKMSGEENFDTDRSDEVLQSLIMSGYARGKEHSLHSDIEKRVKEKCIDNVRPRGAELSGMIQQLENKFNELRRWESKNPSETEDEPSKAANISSATES